MGKLYAIDDDRMFLDIVEALARSMGFEVVPVVESKAFPTVYNGEPDAIVLIDMIMPDVDGIEVVNWLLRGRTPGAVIFVSGYGDRYPELAEQLARGRGLKRIETLAKPIRIDELRAALERARRAIEDPEALP